MKKLQQTCVLSTDAFDFTENGLETVVGVFSKV